MKKRTSRIEQAERTRALILNTAQKLFNEKRYENVTIVDICKSADVSVGAFYHYFSSKDSLVVLYYEKFDQYMDNYREEFNSLAPFDALIFLVERYVDFLSYEVTYPTQICIMQLSSGGNYFAKEDRSFYRNLKNIVSRIYESGTVQEFEEKEFFEFIIRFTRGALYDWCLHEGNYNLKQRVLKDLRIILKGTFGIDTARYILQLKRSMRPVKKLQHSGESDP